MGFPDLASIPPPRVLLLTHQIPHSSHCSPAASPHAMAPHRTTNHGLDAPRVSLQCGWGSAPLKERRETRLVFQGAFIEFKSTKSGFYHVLFSHSELVKLSASRCCDTHASRNTFSTNSQLRRRVCQLPI